ncbi:hypothetical protein SAMN04487759_11529 [Kandleria vitulina]|uniref:Uncharacterized protein n=1 Tax=Kandleria vitulina TaxID=1630 RepID=A0A1H2TRJ7_9FIRM|nr:hypothetical protein SAMN04487759_11529 [Kandleria vitulina]
MFVFNVYAKFYFWKIEFRLKNVATGYRLFKDNSTVYSGADRKFHFNAAPGYKFVLTYKNVNGKVWIIRNNTTKLAQSLISY